MQTPPQLTDRPALARHRLRATDPFLQTDAVTEVQERLIEVNRPFISVAIVTGFPEIWAKAMPDAKIIPDDDTLALTENTHDLIIHALCLHWAHDPVGQLIQCRRALRPDGLFIALTLGGQTLHELRTSLAQAESEITHGLSPRILPMGEIRDLGALLQRAGFALPVADAYTRTILYRDMTHLMHDLRAMGETNALNARLRHPTRRTIFTRAAQIYAQTYAQNGKIPATFETICLTAWAPSDTQPKPLRPGSAAQRLADALNTAENPLPKG
jgi:SAM-dependent methyltransferase